MKKASSASIMPSSHGRSLETNVSQNRAKQMQLSLLLGAVVGVEDNWDTVGWGNGADVVSSGNGTGDGSLLVGVGDTLSTVSALRISYHVRGPAAAEGRRQTFPAK